jgi:heterodisulfide reductase subunit C
MPKTAEPALKLEAELRAAFWDQMRSFPDGQKIKNCLQCGTCTGTCPVSYTMDITPRETVALFRAGMLEEILQSRTIWICASCYSCTVRCPMGIRVTDTLYALKRLAMDKKIYPDKFPVYALSRAFINILYKYGRSFEVILLVHYYLKTSPAKLLANASFGMAMLKRGRLALRPQTVKNVHEVRAIIDRANQLEGV